MPKTQVKTLLRNDLAKSGQVAPMKISTLSAFVSWNIHDDDDDNDCDNDAAASSKHIRLIVKLQLREAWVHLNNFKCALQETIWLQFSKWKQQLWYLSELDWSGQNIKVGTSNMCV